MLDYDYELKELVEITPLPDNILVYGMEGGQKTLASGLIVLDDNGKDRGIKARRGTVFSIGKNIDYLKVGEEILVAHGRWTRGIKIKEADGTTKVIRMVDPKDVLLVF